MIERPCCSQTSSLSHSGSRGPQISHRTGENGFISNYSSRNVYFLVIKNSTFFCKKMYFFCQKNVLFFAKKSTFFAKKSTYFWQKKVLFFGKKKYFSSYGFLACLYLWSLTLYWVLSKVMSWNSHGTNSQLWLWQTMVVLQSEWYEDNRKQPSAQNPFDNCSIHLDLWEYASQM